MNYSIGELSALIGISNYTLRYYEKEGLLYDIQRNDKGIRIYTEKDIDLLNIITCLKETGMSIADIKSYCNMCKKGNATLNERVDMFKNQRNHILEEISTLKKHLEHVNYKIWYYENITKLEKENGPLDCKTLKEIYNAEKENNNYLC